MLRRTGCPPIGERSDAVLRTAMAGMTRAYGSAALSNHTQLLQRRVDPGAVAFAFADRDDLLVLRVVLGLRSIVDLFRLRKRDAQQPVGVADDQITGLDHHA